MPTEMTGEIRSSGGLGLPRVRVGLSVLRGQCVLRGVPFSWPVISGERPQGVSVGYFVRDGRDSLSCEAQAGERYRVVRRAPCGLGLGSDPFTAPRGIPQEVKMRYGRPLQYRSFPDPRRFSRRRPQAMLSAGTRSVVTFSMAFLVISHVGSQSYTRIDWKRDIFFDKYFPTYVSCVKFPARPVPRRNFRGFH